MKKILITIIIVLAILISGILLLTIKPTPKLSNTNILFTFPNNTTQSFYSNYCYTSEKHLKDYQLEIYTLSEEFSNPIITSSSNVNKDIQINPNKIIVTFQILRGTNFNFTVSSDNFETKSATFQATEYIQPENIVLNLATSQTGTQTQYNKNTNNILYLIDTKYQEEALQDGFPSQLYLFPYAQNHTANMFDLSISTLAGINLNTTENKITPIFLDNNYIIVSAKDGSDASAQFLFSVQNAKATSIIGCENEICIDMAQNITHILPTLSTLPAYAKDNKITLESTNTQIFTISNTTLTAQKTGTANLIVYLNDILFKTIPVNITRTLTPKFSFAINAAIDTELAQNLVFDQNQSTITITYGSLTDFYSTLVINVYLLDYDGTLQPTTVTITDPQDAVLEDATTPGFEYGTLDYVPYTINLAHKSATITIEFSKTIEETEIFKTLTIILKEN